MWRRSDAVIGAMSGSRMVFVRNFTEDEILAVLREHEAGAAVGPLCRRHAISIRTFYRWKAEFSRAPLSLLQRVKALEAENARLRALLIEAMLGAETRSTGGRAPVPLLAGGAEERSATGANVPIGVGGE
jgi:putative transposase